MQSGRAGDFITSTSYSKRRSASDFVNFLIRHDCLHRFLFSCLSFCGSMVRFPNNKLRSRRYLFERCRSCRAAENNGTWKTLETRLLQFPAALQPTFSGLFPFTVYCTEEKLNSTPNELHLFFPNTTLQDLLFLSLCHSNVNASFG